MQFDKFKCRPANGTVDCYSCCCLLCVHQQHATLSSCVVCPSVCLSTHRCDAVSLDVANRFHWNLPRIFTMRAGKVFKVKGAPLRLHSDIQRHQSPERLILSQFSGFMQLQIRALSRHYFAGGGAPGVCGRRRWRADCLWSAAAAPLKTRRRRRFAATRGKKC